MSFWTVAKSHRARWGKRSCEERGEERRRERKAAQKPIRVLSVELDLRIGAGWGGRTKVVAWRSVTAKPKIKLGKGNNRASRRGARRRFQPLRSYDGIGPSRRGDARRRVSADAGDLRREIGSRCRSRRWFGIQGAPLLNQTCRSPSIGLLPHP